MDEFTLVPFFVSLKLASLTSIILFFVAFPVAWYLAFTKNRFKPMFEAISALPIVLPPTVLGFYILIFLSQKSFLGQTFKNLFDVSLVFNFYGLLIASVLYSFPFMVQPIQSALESMPKTYLEASYTLGKSKLYTIYKVILPNIKYAVISACVITFSHTMGEFGVVLMVGGSIPGETKVASIAIYEYVETMNYNAAYIYSAILVTFSFLALFIIYFLKSRTKNV
jgi:molybdate transport system permease protein